MTPRQALAFIEKHGIVLHAARVKGVPCFAEHVAGGPIRGSWWGHPKGQEIFRLSEAVADSDQVLTTKLIKGKVTFVHRRLWPALVRLAPRFGRGEPAKVWSEHTASGAHAQRRQAYPKWVPKEILRASKRLTEAEAEEMIGPFRVILTRPS